jgi:hypothetical protein
MSAAAGSGAGDDSLKKSAYGVLQRLLKHLHGRYKLPDDKLDLVVIDALTQHGDHLVAHSIEQKSVDAFKLACWIGGSMLERIDVNTERTDFDTVIDALIATLHELLVRETKWFLVMRGADRRLLKSLIVQEKKGNDRHGIWMNGLYVAFHCGIDAYDYGAKCKKIVM